VTFDEAIGWLNGSQIKGIKPGLENTRRLLLAVENPERGLRVLHVAGTNGKGSVCAILDAVLRESGYRTGLYTSPHLVDFRERIRVDGEMIGLEEAAAGLTRISKATEGWDESPTYFEIGTVLAIDHFARNKCDVVVLETGMGGRFDSTNVVEPLVSVLTPIAMDHMEWLGETIEAIAGEKAGILKPRIPAVSAIQCREVAEVLLCRSREIGSGLTIVDAPWSGVVGLSGEHQAWNAALAAAALEASGLNCPPAALEKGISKVRWPGRFQRVTDRIVVDGAHNRHAAMALAATWLREFGQIKARVVFGALNDKVPTDILEALAPVASEFLFVPLESVRSANPEELLNTTKAPGRVFGTLDEAMRKAMLGDEMVLVAGSLYLAGSFLEWAKQQGIMD
jgi:dihydrofolate synthase / folylpolyglutamate synthase